MIRSQLATTFKNAVKSLALKGMISGKDLPDPEISDTKQAGLGDFTTNFAMVASKLVGMPPQELAAKLVGEIGTTELVEKLEIAGPGFINITLNPASAAQFVKKVISEGETYGRNLKASSPLKINIEFVSVNPNGPITVGSGRGAAFGSALCNVLEAAGHTVWREYYVNDGVNSEQMRQFADSVRSFVEDLPFPEKGYRGDYVQEVAEKVKTLNRPEAADLLWYQETSQELMLERQRIDLSLFGVEFDTWFSEQSLHDNGQVELAIQKLQASGAADDEPYRTVVKFAKGGVIDSVERQTQNQDVDEEGIATESSGSVRPLWLRSTKFGDDMDRVLKRGDGRLTYIASDVAYHDDKFNRPPNADKLITVLGPDHHGYIGRLRAVVAALRLQAFSPNQTLDGDESLIYGSAIEKEFCQKALLEAADRLEVVIFQIVRFVKEGQPAPMRKRDGNIYSLRDLMSEIGKTMLPDATEEEQMNVGRDVSRFFYLMRSHETHMDFDIDLATQKTDDNPVFYCQYAHARICSVIRKAEAELGEAPTDPAGLARLGTKQETALIKKIADLPWEVQRSAKDYGVHRLAAYAQELARTFHHFYDACRVIQPEDPELSAARVSLCRAAGIAMQSVLAILGVSAPERMERAEAPGS